MQNKAVDGLSLHEASLLGDENMIKLLIEKGADIEIKKDDGKTPLEVAVEKTRAAQFICLLSI